MDEIIAGAGRAAPTSIPKRSSRRARRRARRASSASCSSCPRRTLPDQRYQKFRDMGRAGREFIEVDLAGVRGALSPPKRSSRRVLAYRPSPDGWPWPSSPRDLLLAAAPLTACCREAADSSGDPATRGLLARYHRLLVPERVTKGNAATRAASHATDQQSVVNLLAIGDLSAIDVCRLLRLLARADSSPSRPEG